MNNIYLKNEKLSWKVFIWYYFVAYIVGLFFIMILALNNVIKIDLKTIYCFVFGLFGLLYLIQLINPKLNRCIVDELTFRTKSKNAIIMPILFAFGLRVFIDTLQFLPTIIGSDILEVAKGQLDMSSYSFWDTLFVGALLGPFFEELLFRVVIFTSISYILGFIDTKLNSQNSSKVFNLQSIFCWVIIILSNIIFSLYHLPDLSNFHMYFISGIVITLIYIKYGFYSSWISHGLFNLINLNFIYYLLI
ncbi:CPBP family intramembrane glutamic endopeptidase [Sedimentibacter sp.]|uniref:CPBP family intramembrane glutamic endopeptidase n=1 Tax=Sedimentibacter sp. TaxID=1960295 RepID=UPI00289D0B8C|nr:CPBP family intramembrane glutamic endopeptidase [Sedimentibacter sp.]